jgi:hypothetical protein
MTANPLLLLAIALLLVITALELAFMDFTINEIYHFMKRWEAERNGRQ